MGKLYAGTSGWAYPKWKPDFYPAKLAAAKFLGYYSTRLNSVELNYTFRRFPTEKLLSGWIASTPADFKFAVKAHQNITHVKRLKDAEEWTSSFLKALAPLHKAGKLGPVLFQLPSPPQRESSPIPFTPFEEIAKAVERQVASWNWQYLAQRAVERVLDREKGRV